MKPGTTVLPGRSSTRVAGPPSGSPPASVPTATMTPFRTATACATVSWGSTVTTLARRTTRSAASPSPVTPPHPPARLASRARAHAAAAHGRSPALSCPPSAPGPVGPSAASRVGNPEAQGAARRVVVEVVAGALEAGWRGEEREDGGAGGRPRGVLRAVRVDEARDRDERGMVGRELGVREGTLLLDLLDGPGGGAEVAPQEPAGDRHDHQHDQDLDQADSPLAAEDVHARGHPTRPW